MDFLPELVSFYESVEASNLTKYGLFWSYDDRDAMELSISGSGLRPTLNSYMYGNAAAIAVIAGWAEKEDIRELYTRKANSLRDKILKVLWDEKQKFFKVIPQNKRNDEIKEFRFERFAEGRNVMEERCV